MALSIVEQISVHSGEDALHRVEGAVSACAGLSRLIAVGTQVKVITHKALVTFAGKTTFTTSITADSTMA